MEEPLMLHQTVYPCTPNQAIGLAGANANAVNAKATSFETAQYLLQKKEVLNDHYQLLVKQVSKFIEWQKLLKNIFQVNIDLHKLVVLPQSGSIPYDSIVDPWEDVFPFETIFNECCRVFTVHVVGDAWDDYCYPNSQHAGHDRKFAARFFRDVRQTWLRYWYRPVEILIDPCVHLPRLRDVPPAPLFEPKNLELSRCISLREYLIWVLMSRFSHNLQHGQNTWRPPTHKTWCLGSKGRSLGMHRAPEGDFYPLVYWAGNHLYIDCSVRRQGDEKTGTYYVVRPA